MTLTTWLAVLVIVLLTVVAQLVAGVGTDVSWLLTVGERLLGGQRFYVDILETNPPMAALIYLPYVWVGQTTGLAPEFLLIGGVIVLAFFSAWLSGRILERSGLIGEATPWLLLAMAALCLLPGKDFGQREHLAVLLILPLITASASRAVGKPIRGWEAFVVGLAAAVAMAIKPHFALPILVVAVASAIQARSWRLIFSPEHVIAGVMMLAYSGAIWLWFPEFITEMLPLASVAYVPDRRPLLALLVGQQTWLVWLLLAGLAALYWRELRRSPILQMLAGALGFFAVYLIQGKGFGYHVLPAALLLMLAFAQIFVARNSGAGGRGFDLLVALVLVAAPGVVVLQPDRQRQELVEVLRPLGEGLLIGNMTSQIELTSPLHRLVKGRLVNSGPMLWVTLGSVRIRTAGTDPEHGQQLIALEQAERAQLRDDFKASPPDIILTGGDRFNWIGWAREDREMAAILDGYEVMQTLGQPDRPLYVLSRKP